MGVKGLLDTCSRCGVTVFRKLIGRDHDEWDSRAVYDTAPGWVDTKVYTAKNIRNQPDDVRVTLCPKCAEKLLELNDEFLRSGKEDVLDAAD